MAGLISMTGGNLKTMSIGTLDELMDAAVEQQGGDITPAQAYATPLIFRAVDLIAGAVSRLPYYIEDGAENDKTEDATPRYFTQLQYKLAASLLLYNAAYALPERNRYGVMSFRFLPTPLVTYQINPLTNKIDYFEYRNGTQAQRLAPDEIMYWWWPNLNAEVGPGVGPINAALGDAGLARSLTQFADAFFKRGGFPITVMHQTGIVSPDDQQKIISWWNSMISGVKRAFRAVFISDKITFDQIGSNIKDTVAPDLYQQAAHNISIAYGVPLTLLLSDASNYATALSDRVGFYTETVIPQAERIFEVWNERVYEPQGLTIKADPSQLEIMQSYQLEQAAAVQALVGKPLLSVNEGRAMLGYDDKPEDEETPEQPPAATDADTAETDNEMAERDDAIEDERGRLKRYAHKRLGDNKPFAFRSDIIGTDEIDAVKACRTHAEIDAVKLSATRRDDLTALIEAINAARADLRAARNE